MRLRAEQRRKKAEERKERELAKQASGAGTTAETTTLPGSPILVPPLP
jgi:hypothetical protein